MSRTLLVIDIQNDYFAGGALPLWEAERVEARVVAAMNAARTAGDRIVLVRHVATGGGAGGAFSPDSTGVAIRPAIVAAAGNAPIVTKHHADAFQETDLAAHLANTRTLLIAGMMTQNCVVFTALSRAADALSVAIVGDLCTAPTEAVHLIALRALASKCAVRTAGEIWPAPAG